MRRLPDGRTLDRVLATAGVPPHLAEWLVRRLIAFHETAAIVPNDPSYAGGPGRTRLVGARVHRGDGVHR